MSDHTTIMLSAMAVVLILYVVNQERKSGGVLMALGRKSLVLFSDPKTKTLAEPNLKDARMFLSITPISHDAPRSVPVAQLSQSIQKRGPQTSTRPSSRITLPPSEILSLNLSMMTSLRMDF